MHSRPDISSVTHGRTIMIQLSGLVRPHYVLIAYIALVFALGGGARDDLASLAILRPLSIAVLGYALVTIDPIRMRANRILLCLAGAWVMLVALHLVPLPPQVWHALPGRELAAEIDQAAGLVDQWRPISLVPYRTLNSLLSLSVPLAALVLAINLTRSQLRLTVYALIGLVLASALISLLQTIGGYGNPFYLYRITNHDAAVGLFANRNHNAMSFAFGIVALGSLVSLHRPARELRKAWPIALGFAAVALLPFLILTGSRAGLVLGVLGLGGFWLLQSDRDRAQGGANRSRKNALLRNAKMLAGALCAVILSALTWAMTTGGAFTRLMQTNSADGELRLRIWPTAWDLVWLHFPLGSGIGTFVEVFEVAEPTSTLGPSYINHAHNDFLELAMTGGLPAILILIAGALWLLSSGIRQVRAATGPDRTLRLLGLQTLVLLGLGSLYDYPLRTPSIAIVFIMALVWIAGCALHSSPSERSAKQSKRNEQAAASPRLAMSQEGF